MNGPMPKAVTTRSRPLDQAWRELHDESTAPYRQAGRFGWHFARGKLGGDPVFRGLIERGLLTPRSRVVDLGSGQSLLASVFATAERWVAQSRWPADWHEAPVGMHYTGIEMMPRDVERARRALAVLPRQPTLHCADMRRVPLPRCDLVVILDVLHYVDHDDQAALLARVRDALMPRGRLLLRIGDMSQPRGFAISQWVDRTVTRIRGHQVPPTWGRTADGWTALLNTLGFRVQQVPMSQGTPFANVLLVSDLGSLVAHGAAASTSDDATEALR